MIIALLLALTATLQDPPTVPSSIALVPLPRQVEMHAGSWAFNPQRLVIAVDASARPAANALGDAWLRLGLAREVLYRNIAEESDTGADITLELSSAEEALSKAAEAYRLEITSQGLRLSAGALPGLARGSARLLQLVAKIDTGTAPSAPFLSIIDQPAAAWRGIMIDVARFPHTIEDVREVVELAWLAGLNRVHLHLSDDQLFTFPSTAFPELASVTRTGERRHFTREELVGLVAFATARGVMLVPEIDMPAHASVLVRARPDLFGTVDSQSGEASSTGVINMASERAYEALDVLIGEVCEVFSESAYVHLGADEVSADHLRDLPEYDTYVRAHGLPLAIAGDVRELYNHFVVRVCEMVRKRGRRPVLWEGFHGQGTAAAPIPKDVLVMAWELGFQTPTDLAAHGYELINCSWDPFYVVPSQCWAASTEQALNWNLRDFRQRLGGAEFHLQESAAVLGGQICVWEQRPEAILGASYEVLAALSERMWNPAASMDGASHVARRQPLDRITQQLLRPNRAQAVADASERDGRSVATADQAYAWRAAWPIPRGHTQVFDVDTIGVRAEGRFARTNAARITAVNRELFARVAERGHIDTRIPAEPVPGLEWLPRRQWQPYALELSGLVHLPSDGTWSFAVRANDGAAELSIGGVVAATSKQNRVAEGRGHLSSGTYAFRVRYHFEYVQNELNILVQGPGMTAAQSFDDFVVLGTAKPDAAAVIALSPGTFEDPDAVLHLSLATGKPIRGSAPHQGDMHAGLAVDGRLGNESGWHCGESPASLVVDLESTRVLARAHLVFFSDGARFYQYRLELSPDGDAWTEVVDAAANTVVSTRAGVQHSFAPTAARFLRLVMLRNSANPGVHVNEIMVFGAEAGDHRED